MDSLERFLLIASSDDVTQAIDFAALDRIAGGAQRTQVGCKEGCFWGRWRTFSAHNVAADTSAAICPAPSLAQYLGMALQNVLRQYTNAAASIVSDLLSFTTKFAIQVG